MLILTCQTLHSLGEQTQPGLKMENKKGKNKINQAYQKQI